MPNKNLKGKVRFLWAYHLLLPAARWILWAVNTTIRKVSHDPTFFDTDDFPWVRKVEAYFPDIKRECLEIIKDLSHVPNLDEISEGSTKLAQGGDWKGYLVMAFGKVAPRNALRCPRTVEAMRLVPAVNTVAFSVLAPGVHLPRHTGDFSGILRYHMGVIVPPGPDCRIQVDDEIRTWQEGKSILFDDTHPHEVWNDTPYTRVVLFVDFVRPTLWPLRMIIRFLLWAVSLTTYTRDVIRNAEEYQPKPNAEVPAIVS